MSAPLAVQQHFVIFHSPGTFFDEQTEKPVESWDVKTAIAMMADITERYGARPYGFRFVTRGRTAEELNARNVNSSGFYFVGGKIGTVEEVEARNDPNERILLSNMKGNGWDRIHVTTEGWKSTHPLQDGDTVLTKEGEPLR